MFKLLEHFSVMKFSIITSVYNNRDMIACAMASVASQQKTEVKVEHVVVDGNSKDGTKEYLSSLDWPHVKFKSEKDDGIYDGLNKGLSLATGDIIGILHSDDFFADENVLFDVQKKFEEGADVVYGDLLYVDRANGKTIIRDWKAGCFSELDLKMGWMPPHPTFFFRRDLLKDKGFFSTSFRIAGDYDHMLRFLTDSRLKILYCPRVITHMRIGGASNKSIRNILNKTKEDIKVASKYFDSPILTVLFKNIRKIGQLRAMKKIICL